ncbi:MAG: nucleotidyltransferase family protein [Oscillospiraceae bacterium]|nr:nucleotidyltransferase family protein [Oscillospiraceae bacterium]
MKIVGIVAEYNPFHAGHGYQIAETRRRVGECAVVCAMSGNFVQRGDCAVADKWSRAKAALEGGADLVLELPTVWAASSAEHFAFGSVYLLREAGVDTLSFGSESGDGEALKRAAAALDSEQFGAALRSHLDEGLPFALCRQRAAEELLGEAGAACLKGANDNLGVEYLKAARRLDFDPRVIAVPRVGAGHDGGEHPDYPSASHLRKEILEGCIPADNPAGLIFAQRAVLAALRSMTLSDFEALPDSGEGLANRLYSASRQAVSLEELYGLAKTKRYAHARIRRMVLWAALGLKQSDRPQTPPYLRVLAANERGREVLKGLHTPLPVITKPVHGKGIPLMELEARCTDFYALCRRTPVPCGAEWSTSPIIR